MSPHPRSTAARMAVALAVAAPVFLALDSAWLWFMTDRLYRPLIGHLMRPDLDVLAGAAFYALYLVCGTALVVLPAAGPRAALWRGALFGLAAYGTYDLTNQATLRAWPWALTLADLAWGTAATAVTAVAARTGLQRFERRRPRA